MKVLITGVNGYIGKSLEGYLTGHEVRRIDLKKPFTENELKGFDTVIHTAALVHLNDKGYGWNEYYKINTELSYELAQKCKNAGVGHFIFISTMSVFEGERIINVNTKPNPKSYYGKSKLLAEEKILSINGDGFLTTIIRPPMVYGKNCPGNFARLVKHARYMPVFPKCNNKRSMIYIEHLLEFIKIITEEKIEGVFHPQNKEYTCTSDLVFFIRNAYGKKTVLLPGFGFLKQLNLPVFKKLFSDMVYSHGIDEMYEDYCSKTFEETVELSI